MPFFSIVIPTFNRPEQLKRALNSVLAQRYNDYEVLVINNSDVPVEQISNDKRLFIYNESQPGANNARNKGISLSKAEFICFLDDDDEYLPNHLETLYNLIAENKFKVAFYKTFASRENEDGKFIEQSDPLKPPTMHNLEYILRYPIYMNCVCIHKNLLEHAKFSPNVKVAQDYDLWMRILINNKIFIAPIVTNIYHYSKQSTSRPSKEKYYDYINLYSSYFEDKEYGKFIPTKIKNDRIFKYYYWMMCEFKNEQSFLECIRNILKMIYYNPSILLQKRLFALLLKSQSQSIHPLSTT